MRIWLPVVRASGVAATQAARTRSPATARTRRPTSCSAGHGPIGIRGNWIFSRAGSDWYDFVTDQLTLDRKATSTGPASRPTSASPVTARSTSWSASTQSIDDQLGVPPLRG